MKLIRVEIPSDKVEVMPISDLHIGDKGFTKESLEVIRRNLIWVKRHENARVFLLGDILNCGTKDSPTSLFDQELDLDGQIEFAVKLFKPIKDKIMGAVDGNHEQRLMKYAGYSPTKTLCDRLGVTYCESSAVILLRLGRKKGSSFVLFLHHTTGGGVSPGSKMNRVDKLRGLCLNADVFIGSHNHMISATPLIINTVNKRNKSLRVQKQFLVDSGSYLTWDGSYAEQKMLQPTKIGSPRIVFSVKNKIKDIFVSI